MNTKVSCNSLQWCVVYSSHTAHGWGGGVVEGEVLGGNPAGLVGGELEVTLKL